MHFLTFNISDLLIGEGTDSGKYAYKIKLGYTEKYVITKGYIGYKIKVNGTELTPIFHDVNGNVYFQSNRLFLWFQGKQWILMGRNDNVDDGKRGFPGYQPMEWRNSETEEMEGDEWWSGTLPTASGQTQIFYPHGTAEGEKTVEFYMPRWEQVSGGVDPNEIICQNIGTYSDPDGVEDDLTVGTLMFSEESNSSKEHLKSITRTTWRTFVPGGFWACYKEYNYFTYGEIYYAYTDQKRAWVIGVLSSPDGWYEGEEPQKDRDVTFTFQLNPIEEISLHLRRLFVKKGDGSFYYPTFYDNSTSTIRMADKKVNPAVGWLECPASELDENLTFQLYNPRTNALIEDSSPLVYNVLQLLKAGENPMTDVYSSYIAIRENSIREWRCYETEKITKNIQFSVNHITKPDRVIVYEYLVSGDVQEKVWMAEAPIWR